MPSTDAITNYLIFSKCLSVFNKLAMASSTFFPLNLRSILFMCKLVALPDTVFTFA